VTQWHILTGEYPPQEGGVSDYTRRVARGLSDAGDRVDVWAPPVNHAKHRFSDAGSADSGVTVHRLPDRFGIRSLRLLTKALDRLPPPRRILVQYVPQAFGLKGANVPFCLWLRSRRRDSVWVMFHEVAYPFERRATPSRAALAIVNRLMAALVAASAERAFVSIPGWQSSIRTLVSRETPVEWLPVPSGMPVVCNSARSAEIRARYAGDAPLVGHFGTHGPLVASLLETCVPPLVETSGCDVLLIGRGSYEACCAVIREQPSLTGRVLAAGPLTDEDVSLHIAACDVMLQPYPDGVSTRRTTAMAALSHGVPLITTRGWLTEPLWNESGAAVLVDVGDPSALAREAARLLRSPADLARLSANGRSLYESRFALVHTIDALRAAEAGAAARVRVRA
jgi:glycosyltransferase involved in cell wall biosynthesis